MRHLSLFSLYRQEFGNYSLAGFRKDLFAGLTVGAVALPLALAFGVASGATASAGLVTAILSGLIIGAFSGASFQISGPTGAMSAILIVLSQRYGIEGVWIAGFFSGVLLLLLGLFRLGRFVSFIPAPVISGFTSGIAIIIAVGQIDSLFGTHAAVGDTALQKLLSFVGSLPPPNWHALGIGLFVLLGVVSWPKRFGEIIPGSLFFLCAATGIHFAFGLDAQTIGSIPRTILLEHRLAWSAIPFDRNLLDFAVPIFAITALGAIESLLCGAVGASLTGTKLYANQELVAQGLGNMILPFFGGVPATAAIARSSVGIKAGGKTRMVSIVHAIILLASVFLLAPLMAKIPLSALAGILIITAWKMNEWEQIHFYFSKKMIPASLKYLVTMVATFSFDLTIAIGIGMLLAAAFFIAQISRLTLKVSDIDPDKLKGSEIPYAPILHSTSVVYISGPLFFGAVGEFLEALSGLAHKKAVILSMRGVPMIDSSGLRALQQVHNDFRKSGCDLYFAGLTESVEAFLTKVGFIEEIGRTRLFWSTDQALRSLAQS